MGEVFFKEWREFFEFDLIDVIDDVVCMRGDDLGAVFEVDFKAVIGGRVMAGAYDNAGSGFEIADGEAELRSGSWAIEDEGTATACVPGGSGEFAEVAGVMPDVVCDDELGRFFVLQMCLAVAEEADGCLEEVEVVQVSGSYAWVFRGAVCGWGALFGLWGDGADCLASHTACAEFECFVKAVIELIPSFLVDQFFDGVFCP